MHKGFEIPLSPEQLMSEAREETGINIVDDKAVEPLMVLVNSLNKEGDMFESGALELQKRILQMLKNRLRMLRDFRDHPEIHDQQIKAPIMISGTLRTGSTKLQNILAASGDFNWLNFWKVYNFASFTGQPNEDCSERIAEVDEYLAYNERVSPDIKIAHVQETYTPEEETLIAMQTFCSPSWFGYGNIPSYMEWVSQQDLTPTFEFVRDALKYLQWQGLADPGRRWVLKSPFNVGLEDIISRVFPDACFVVTHRPPTETLPSLFSLLEALIKCHSHRPQVNSEQMAMGQAMSLERHLQVRQEAPGIPMLDINFSESISDSENVIRRVYDFAGETLSEVSLQTMQTWNENNPMHKHGKHCYSLADYGLSEGMLAEFCPNYMAFYKAKYRSLRL